ncbi:MAG: hypothetical protein RBT39_16365 [Azoarcus sp.]|jgi:hypothetical protein|nr:hypothetical protein [Azoarcus sp.]MDD2873866.1 hypothetical protein [Azoarcus sp.]MDX9839136.1 hypothetical protein [Azoarcus sp.]
MKLTPKALLATLLCAGLMAAGGAANAHDDDRGWSKSERREYRHYQRSHRHDHADRRTVIRERVVVREAPRYYREREVREYYYAPPVRSYSRDPAVVIGLSIPPIVIPFR